MKNRSKKIMVILAIVIVLIIASIVIPMIVKGGSSSAQKAQVLSGKTFTNGSAVAIAGQMQNFGGQIPEVTATAADEDYIATIDLDDGYYESVKINAKPIYDRGVSAGATTHTETYTYASGSTGGKVDLGASHTYRYVNATNVYNKGKADGQASPSISTQTKTITISNNGPWKQHSATFTFAHGVIGVSSFRTDYDTVQNHPWLDISNLSISGNTVTFYTNNDDDAKWKIVVTAKGY